MNTIVLEIADFQYLKINLPCEKENLEPFTIITIKYVNESTEYDLYVNDFIIEAIKALRVSLDKAIDSHLQIQIEYIDKGIGYFHNIYSQKLWTSDNFDMDDPGEDFIVWSTPSNIGIETYMYNIHDEIYFEISPFYKWNSDIPDDQLQYESFDNFIDHYSTIRIINVEKKVALLMQKCCNEIIKILNDNEKKRDNR